MSAIEIVLDLGVLGEHTFSVEYDYVPGRPAVISGPPENCYEAEAAEIHISKVTAVFGTPVGDQLKKELITYLDENTDFYDKVVSKEECT